MTIHMYVIIYQRKSSISLCFRNSKWILNVLPNHDYSNDTYKQIRLSFSTCENAVRFAESHNMHIIPCTTKPE